MATKPVLTKIKLQVPGGQATPAPPVGPALGQHGVNIGEFVKRFNDRTRDENGMILPVVITVFRDKTFDFVTKSPPAAWEREYKTTWIFSSIIEKDTI